MHNTNTFFRTTNSIRASTSTVVVTISACLCMFSGCVRMTVDPSPITNFTSKIKDKLPIKFGIANLISHETDLPDQFNRSPNEQNSRPHDDTSRTSFQELSAPPRDPQFSLNDPRSLYREQAQQKSTATTRTQLAAPLPVGSRPTNQPTMPPRQSTFLSTQLPGAYGDQIQHRPPAINRLREPPNPAGNLKAELGQSRNNQALFDQPANGTRHLEQGPNMSGTTFRKKQLFATEIVTKLQTRNDNLNKKIKSLNATIKTSDQTIKTRNQSLEIVRQQLALAEKLNVKYRQSLATHQVKIQDLENEKRVIEQNADAALKNIEQTLNSVLLNTIPASR